MISSEWALPKTDRIQNEAPEIYSAAKFFDEGCDWAPRKLEGGLERCACAEDYRTLGHKKDGFPSIDILSACGTELPDLYMHKLAGPISQSAKFAGSPAVTWANRIDLNEGVPDCAKKVGVKALGTRLSMVTAHSNIE